MSMLDLFLIHYLQRFDKVCFNVSLHGKVYKIGEGEPKFTVKVNKDIPKKQFFHLLRLRSEKHICARISKLKVTFTKLCMQF